MKLSPLRAIVKGGITIERAIQKRRYKHIDFSIPIGTISILHFWSTNIICVG